MKIYDDFGWRPGYLWACDPAKAGSCKKSDPNSDIRREARGYCLYGSGRLIADKKDYPAEAPDPGTTFVTKQGDAWVVGYNGFVSSTAGATVFKTVNCLKTLPTGPPQPKPPPPPSPPPAPKPKPAGQLGIDYSMPNRFGLLEEHGLVDYQTTKDEIAPDEWRVNLYIRRKDRKPCRLSDLIAVTANGVVLTPVKLKRITRCTVQAKVPREGAYRVVVRMKTSDGVLRGERDILVQDWLIVGLGDSNGSGEGSPDVSGQIVGQGRVWQNTQCHRSARSFEAQAAAKIELRDPRTSVTFVHLACSGATIRRGLLGVYEGIEPIAPPGVPKRSLLRPQVAEMKSKVFGREIDAALISIGVNDLRFGPMVYHCLTKSDCQNKKFEDPDWVGTLAAIMRVRLDGLPESYARLARSLGAAGAAADRVYLGEYFDSTGGQRRKDGSPGEETCNPLIRSPLGYFDGSEAAWAYENVLKPLNARVRAATIAHDWHYIAGPAAEFRTHGYCSSDSWIVSLTGSKIGQGNTSGALHATPFGNEHTAAFAVELLLDDFYGKSRNRTRAPKS